MAFCCLPCGCAGAGAHLEKTGFRVEGVSNFALRPFSRAAKKHRKRDEEEYRKQPQNASKKAHRKNFEKPPNMVQHGANMAPKIDPGGLRRPVGGRRRTQEAHGSTKPEPKWPQERAKSARKRFSRKCTIFGPPNFEPPLELRQTSTSLPEWCVHSGGGT